MEQNKITIERDKKIALVAHDNKKRDLVEWAKYNRIPPGASYDICYRYDRRVAGAGTRFSHSQA